MDVITVAVEVAGIAVVAFAVERLLSRGAAKAARRAGVAPNEVRQIQDALGIIVVALAALAILHVLGISSATTTLSLSAVAGLAVTLALQSTLQNIIAGLFMIRDHTLRLDDDIEVSGVRGKVVKLGFRSAWLLNGQGSVVIVSNSTLAAGPFVNHTAAERLGQRIPTAPT